MSLTLLRRRRRFAEPPVAAATGCTCTVHHPVTDAERSMVADGIVLARWAGDENRAVYLTAQLTTTCRTTAARPLCPCGCGYPPEKHVPQVTQLLDHWRQVHGDRPIEWPDRIQVAYENTAGLVLSGGWS